MGGPAVSLRDVGIHFRVARRSRDGRTPWMRGARHRDLWGIRHVTLDVAPGEVIGLIGQNGAGKTTLLRTVAGVYRPDEGTVEVRGRVGPMLSVTGGMMPRLSGWQNIALLMALLGIPRGRREDLTRDVAGFSGLGEFLDAEVRTYSSGMRARLGFSVAAFADPDILAVDEVLAVGDEEFRERSEEVIRSFVESDRTVLLASHDVERLVEMCRRVVRMDHGEVVAVGEPKEVAERYLADLHAAGIDPASLRRRGGRRGP